jgi:hypothetical protein
MKALLILLFLPLNLLSQENLKELLLPSLKKYYGADFFNIGENQEFMFYVRASKGPIGAGGIVPEELTYFKLSNSDGQDQIFDTGKLKLSGGFTLLRQSSFIVGDFIYEYYKGAKAGLLVQAQKDFLVKRKLDDFAVVESIELDQTVEKVYFHENGIYLQKKGIGAICMDYSFKKIWEKDFDEFKVKNSWQTKTNFIENDQKFVFQLDLAECKDCGIFKRKKSFDESLIALVIYDKDGNKSTLIPEFKEEFIFSHSNYFLDDGDLIGIFDTHYKGETDYEDVVGQGYSFFKWDVETGEIIEDYNIRFTYEILGDEKKSSDYYPKLRNSKSKIIQTKEGNLYIYYGSLRAEKDKKTQSKELLGVVVIPISETGEPIDFHICHESFYPIKMCHTYTDEKIYFVGQGYDKNEKKTVVSNGSIDLKTGSFEYSKIQDVEGTNSSIPQGLCGFNEITKTYTFCTIDLSDKNKLIEYRLISE